MDNLKLPLYSNHWDKFAEAFNEKGMSEISARREIIMTDFRQLENRVTAQLQKLSPEQRKKVEPLIKSNFYIYFSSMVAQKSGLDHPAIRNIESLGRKLRVIGHDYVAINQIVRQIVERNYPNELPLYHEKKGTDKRGQHKKDEKIIPEAKFYKIIDEFSNPKTNRGINSVLVDKLIDQTVGYEARDKEKEHPKSFSDSTARRLIKAYIDA